MKQKFQNTIIIVMSCNGMEPWLASALIERGAKAYIAWSNWVTITRTDQAVLHLLERLIIKKQTVEQAIRETMNKIGPDPIYNSTLKYYPPEAGNYTIPN